MLPDEVRSVAERHVPGAGALDIQRLSQGQVNDTYRVLRDGRGYGLRVAAENCEDLGLDRAWELRVIECAVRAGLAPAVEYFDLRRGILISRWIEGRTWSAAAARRASNIARMAALARRVHALPIPQPARLMSPQDWIEHYCAAARHRAGSDAPALWESGPAEALRAAADERLAALAALPSPTPTVCHSDLHLLNVVDCGRSLVLLDWEYAHVADPFWDLAGWSANNDFNGELARDLLSAYSGRAPLHGEYSRLNLLGWLYDYVCLLWGELQPGGGAARGRQLAARLVASASGRAG